MIKVRESPRCPELVSEISDAGVIGLGENRCISASELVASVAAPGKYRTLTFTPEPDLDIYAFMGIWPDLTPRDSAVKTTLLQSAAINN